MEYCFSHLFSISIMFILLVLDQCLLAVCGEKTCSQVLDMNWISKVILTLFFLTRSSRVEKLYFFFISLVKLCSIA